MVPCRLYFALRYHKVLTSWISFLISQEKLRMRSVFSYQWLPAGKGQVEAWSLALISIRQPHQRQVVPN